MSGTFEEYVAARGHALVRFGHVLTGDFPLAEDLVQDALARAHPRWRKIGRMEYPDAYVRRMVVNGYLSWRRSRSSRVQPLADPPALPAADPATEHAERDAMWRLLATLPKRQRAVLVLRFYEGLPDNEIAQALGCSEATVRGHSARALLRLRATAPQGVNP